MYIFAKIGKAADGRYGGLEVDEMKISPSEDTKMEGK